jgi:hypothetical protein
LLFRWIRHTELAVVHGWDSGLTVI